MQIKYIIIIKWWRIRRGEEWKMKNWRIRNHKKRNKRKKAKKSHSGKIMNLFFSHCSHVQMDLCYSTALTQNIRTICVWTVHSSYHSDFHMGGHSFLSHLFALTFTLSPQKKKLDNTQQYHIHILNNKCKAYDLLVPAEYRTIFDAVHISSFFTRSNTTIIMIVDK